MRRLFLAAALFLAVPAPADQRLTCGTVEALEITSLTKARLTSFLRTVLPEAPPGSKIFFEGKIDLANTVLPVGPRMTALAQHAEGRHEVVFLVDVELAKLPPELVSRLNANALDLTLEGNLRSSDSSSGVSPVPVCAAGVLKIGTPEIRSSVPLGQEFARFSGARFAGVSLSETLGEATILLYNPLSFPLDVKDLVYEIQADGRRVASGEKHGLRIHPGRENAIALPVTASNAELLGVLAGAVASGGRIDGRLVATATVKVGKDQGVTVPLNLPGTIQVTR